MSDKAEWPDDSPQESQTETFENEKLKINQSVIDAVIPYVAPGFKTEAMRPILEEARPILEHARTLQVVDEASWKIALNGVARCKRSASNFESLFQETKDAMNTAKTKLMDAIHAVIDPLKEAAILYDRKATTWKRDEDRRRAAKAKEEEEAERRRLDNEKLDIATELDDKGLHKAAEKVLQAPSTPVHVEPKKLEMPKGQSYVPVWDFEIIDEEKIPREYLTPNLTAIRAYGKAMKAKAVIPGVRFFDRGTIRTGKT